ncbi:MAG: hypothetical protein WBP64_07655 [Nitrososphaeraceae archaeon]|jgi:hypothetical protein
MDLPTHFAFAFTVGLLFFDKPEIELLIALGAVFPDLDREYWFCPRRHMLTNKSTGLDCIMCL